MTNYEYDLKEELKGKTLNREQLLLCNILNKKSHTYMPLLELTEVKHIIKTKEVYPSIIGEVIFRCSNSTQAVKLYNANATKVINCLTRKQWDLLMDYYTMVHIKEDKNDAN